MSRNFYNTLTTPTVRSVVLFSMGLLEKKQRKMKNIGNLNHWYLIPK